MNCLLLGESLRSDVSICILNTGFPAGFTSLLREAACFAGVVVTSDASTSGVSVVSLEERHFQQPSVGGFLQLFLLYNSEMPDRCFGPV